MSDITRGFDPVTGKFVTLRMLTAPDDASGGTGDAVTVPPGGITLAQKSTAGGPAYGQTLQQFANKIALSGSVQTSNLLTVPASKTWYTTDIVLFYDGTGTLEVQIQNSGAAIFFAGLQVTAACYAAGLETGPQVPAGNILQINVPAGSGNVRYFVAGFYQ